MNIKEIFDGVKVISIIANQNSGKTNMIYHLIDELTKLERKPNIYEYGLRIDLDNVEKVQSLIKLETIRDSVIFIDEFVDLFRLDDRRNKLLVETTIRKIYHNNNILILIGLPENYNKFICGKTHLFGFKAVTIADLINGSKAKEIVMGYCGNERGNYVLDLPKNQILFTDGIDYEKVEIPYMQDYDSKKDNKTIVEFGDTTYG